MSSLTLFFPMYNEREAVERMTLKALEVLDGLVDEYEVMIVDDGSTDGSERIADELAGRHPQVRVVHHPRNLGYGIALQTGLQNATKDLVIYTDCDEPVDLFDIERALSAMGSDVDGVIGYRIKRYDTLRRFVYSKAYNFLCRLLLGVRVRDVNFSFKLLRREMLQCVRLSAGSAFIDGELLAEARRCGHRVVEIPVEYLPRRSGRSSFDSLYAAFHTGEELLAYWWRTRVRRR